MTQKIEILNEMEYRPCVKPLYYPLARGSVDGYEFEVISYGSHPCAYVKVPKHHPFSFHQYLEIESVISVHGGLTYSGERGEHNGWWFGWDYAHCEDYTAALLGDMDGKQWTTQEIVDACLDVISQFKALENGKATEK